MKGNAKKGNDEEDGVKKDDETEMSEGEEKERGDATLNQQKAKGAKVKY